ncbi:alpha/beta hydrolase [Sphingobium aromaticiconvertens]|uniref:alpha/beta fold hydrolase n=1 Tax=Sphingobium aromaticiconvertens TaxID=365341 RepID=UPI0030186CED
MRDAPNNAPYQSIWTHLHGLDFEQRYIKAGAVRTRYAHAGRRSAPAVIMLHGTGGHWESFCANLAAHAEHYDCYALDFVGSGLSDKPAHPYEIATYVEHVLNFMSALNLEKASIIGVSLGSWVAAAIAIAAPERVEKLVLLSAAGYFSTAANRAQIKKDRGGSAADPSWERIKGIFSRLLAREEARIDDLIGLRQALYSMPGAAEAMQNVLVLQNPDIRQKNLIQDDGWRAIVAPALVVGSLADSDEYLDTARIVSKLIPDASYVEMEGVGHWPQFEDPETFNRLSVAFLKGG